MNRYFIFKTPFGFPVEPDVYTVISVVKLITLKAIIIIIIKEINVPIVLLLFNTILTLLSLVKYIVGFQLDIVDQLEHILLLNLKYQLI